MTSCVPFAVPRDFLARKTRRRHNYGVRIVRGEPSKGVAATNPPSCKQPMKKSALVLMLSAAAICEADAGEAILRSVHVAQMNQPTPPNSSGGNCMPIGLTARGELVFPWECREIIERERGPVSADISAALEDPAKTTAQTGPAREPAPNAAAVDDAASKDQPALRSTEPEQVGTILDVPPIPPHAAATVRSPDRRFQAQRSAARRPADSKSPAGVVQPSTVRPNRVARVPPAQ